MSTMDSGWWMMDGGRRTGWDLLRATAVFLVLVLLTQAASVRAEVKVTRGRLELPIAEFTDDNALFVENEFLKMGISVKQDPGGAILSLLYKPTGHQLGPRIDTQGYFRDRMGQGRGFWRGKNASNFKLEVVSQGDEEAVVRYSYTWHRDGTDIRLSKDFTLRAGEAVIYCTWKIENRGEGKTNVTPWIKHVGGIGPEDQPALLAPPVVMAQDGLARGGEPITNWAIRRSSEKENTSELPMVSAVYTFEDLAKYYNWAGRRSADSSDRRFSLEAILRNISLDPGESWQTTNALAVSANLKRPMYVAPELAAGASVETKNPRAGQPVEVTLHIAPSVEMGARRLEGDAVAFEDGQRISLPNRQVELRAGKITNVSYTFTPPQEGVYTLNLGVFKGQPLQRLGQAVNSQQSSINVPIVIGPKPDEIVKKWETGGSVWRKRQPRQLTPDRTLVTTDRLQAGQILVPGRIFPVDTLKYAESTEPGYIRLAANQHESFQFSVDVAEDVDPMEVTIEVSPFKGNGGRKLDDIMVFEEMYLTTNTPSKYNARFPVGHYPGPLFKTDWPQVIPDAPFAKRNTKIMRDCRRRMFWITLKTPKDAAPGVYTAQVKLTLGGEEMAAFPIGAQVSDFVLPTRPSYNPSTGMVGWGSKNTLENMGLTKEKRQDLSPGYWGKYDIDAYRRLVIGYGWSPTMWSGLSLWKDFHDYGRGMTVFSTNAKRGSETSKWLKEHDLMKYAFVYAPFDEHTDSEVPEVLKWAKDFREKSDVPIGDCYYGDRIDPLINLVDVWIGQNPRSDHWGKPTGPYNWGHKAVDAKKRGVKFYAVNASLIWFLELNPVNGRSQFWSDFTVGYDGRYVYSTCRWTDDLYEDNFTAGQGNYLGCATYIGPHGITTGIRMETLRDGVYDYDYLTLLNRAVKKAKQSGRSHDLADAIEKAEKILHDPNLSNRVRTAEKLHATREQIADLIEILKD